MSPIRKIILTIVFFVVACLGAIWCRNWYAARHVQAEPAADVVEPTETTGPPGADLPPTARALPETVPPARIEEAAPPPVKPAIDVTIQASTQTALQPAVAVSTDPIVTVARAASRRIDVSDDEFFDDKLKHAGQFDLVFGGDSRTLCGVSPGEMLNVLPDLRIYNFAFRGVCFSGAYLKMLSRLLDQSSKGRKLVVLGVSPISLTEANIDRNGFKSALMHQAESSMGLGSLRRKVEAEFVPIGDLGGEVPVTSIHFAYHDDGWMMARRWANRAYIKEFETTFKGQSLDGQVRRDLMDAVRSGNRDGVTVFAFRPPTSPEVTAMENESLHFDEDAFVREFTHAGGIWLNVDSTGLEWQDLHHLDPPSAVVYSNRMAVAIRDALAARDESVEHVSAGAETKEGT